jgi:cell division protein FtsQ
LKDDSVGRALKGQILSVTKFIETNPFWMAQISHVAIDSGNLFTLIPLLGNQKIILGDTGRMKEKFDNLLVFYKKVANRIGWDKYQVLDLRYKGQVIASPALPWMGPKDKAVVNMDWTRSMVDSSLKANKAFVKDTTHVAAAKAVVPVKRAINNKKIEIVKPKPVSIHKTVPASAKKALTKKIEKKKVKDIEKNDKEKKQSPKYIYQKKVKH